MLEFETFSTTSLPRFSTKTLLSDISSELITVGTTKKEILEVF